MFKNSASPVTNNDLPTPTPPATYNAFEVTVAVLDCVLLIDTALLVVAPLLVIVCSVPVFQIVTAPVDALTAVSVPAVIIDTPYVPKVAVVNTREPLSYTALAYNAPPMPTPPTTCKAPVFVEVALVELVIDTALLVVAPLLVIVCSVLVFHTVTAPVDVLTAVSVPAVSVLTP